MPRSKVVTAALALLIAFAIFAAAYLLRFA
jgi:hypothetical protein